jgi:hypothetical protein
MPMLLDLPARTALVNSSSFMQEMIAYGYKYAGLFLVDSLTYKWQAGDGPAPGDFGYTIQITPGSQGEFTFRRHELSQPPAWIKTFKPNEVELAKFYGLMVEQGLFTRQWKPRPEVTGNASRESLNVTVLGKDYSIPSRLSAEEAAIAGEMYTAFESLVPAQIWAKFMAEHEPYGLVPRLLSLEQPSV